MAGVYRTASFDMLAPRPRGYARGGLHTENGAEYPDVVVTMATSSIRARRYIESHVDAIRGMAAGVPVEG